jgi:uncharacterized protein YbjT (DUF2867 family)
MNDAAALTDAFKGVDGVFVLVPPNFDPSPDFREAQSVATTLTGMVTGRGKVIHPGAAI